MTRELDDLMNLDPLEMSDQDIDQIIAYERERRRAFIDGVKLEKPQSKPVDLVKLGLKKPVEKMNRRF